MWNRRFWRGNECVEQEYLYMWRTTRKSSVSCSIKIKIFRDGFCGSKEQINRWKFKGYTRTEYISEKVLIKIPLSPKVLSNDLCRPGSVSFLKILPFPLHTTVSRVRSHSTYIFRSNLLYRFHYLHRKGTLHFFTSTVSFRYHLLYVPLASSEILTYTVVPQCIVRPLSSLF